jgi:16S rRNA (guanine966-N2)-methyltransferase
LGPDGVPVLDGARVLDAFAGTGAMGLEALSRGAAHVTFMERDSVALQCLQRNIESLGEEEQCHVLRTDAARPPFASAPADLAFLDPPYGTGLAAPALAALAAAGWLAPGAVVVLEHGDASPFASPAGFEAIDKRRYGRSRFAFIRFRDSS